MHRTEARFSRFHKSTLGVPLSNLSAYVAGGILGFAGSANLLNMPLAPSLEGTLVSISIAAAIAVFCFLALGRRANRFGQIPGWITGFAGFLPGLFVASISSYGAIKVLGLGFGLLLALVGAIGLDSRRFLVGVTTVLVAGGLIASVLMLAGTATTSGGRATIEGLNPLGPARLAGTAFMLLSLVWILKAISSKRVLYASAGLLSLLPFVALLNAETRGPIWSAVASVGIVVLVCVLRRQLRLRRGLPVLVVGTIGIGLGGVALVGDGSRLVSGQSVVRMALFKDSWEMFLTSPLGVGWGNFGPVAGSSPESLTKGRFAYPHNVLAEAASEGGVPAFAGLLLLMVCALYSAVNAVSAKWLGATSWLPLAVLLFAVLNSMVSSDMGGNRLLWVAIGLCLGVEVVSRRAQGASSGRGASRWSAGPDIRPSCTGASGVG